MITNPIYIDAGVTKSIEDFIFQQKTLAKRQSTHEEYLFLLDVIHQNDCINEGGLSLLNEIDDDLSGIKDEELSSFINEGMEAVINKAYAKVSRYCSQEDSFTYVADMLVVAGDRGFNKEGERVLAVTPQEFCLLNINLGFYDDAKGRLVSALLHHISNLTSSSGYDVAAGHGEHWWLEDEVDKLISLDAHSSYDKYCAAHKANDKNELECFMEYECDEEGFEQYKSLIDTHITTQHKIKSGEGWKIYPEFKMALTEIKGLFEAEYTNCTDSTSKWMREVIEYIEFEQQQLNTDAVKFSGNYEAYRGLVFSQFIVFSDDYMEAINNFIEHIYNCGENGGDVLSVPKGGEEHFLNFISTLLARQSLLDQFMDLQNTLEEEG